MPQSRTPQHPAPVIDAENLLAWYDRHARNLPWRVPPAERAAGVQPDPYRVWLSEIMLQQTTIAAVRTYYLEFTSRWPTVEALAAAPLDDVLSAWAGLGYYARARNLHACANVVAHERSGVFPATSADLLALPGIGPYTAAAIAAICHDEPVAVVDGNVERVVSRLLRIETPVRDAKPEIRDAVQQSVPKRAGDFAQAMMDLGATLCAPRAAACMLCPLQTGCAATGLPDPTVYPRKAAKAERPTRFGHAYVALRADGAVWLRRRADKGLLAKMTEVPGSEWSPAKHEPTLPEGQQWRSVGSVVHVFTHFRLELTVWRATTDAAPGPDGWWSPPDQLGSEALPSLFRKVLAAALD